LIRLDKDTKEQIKLADYKEELAKEENKNKTDEELDKLKEEIKEKNKQIKENSIILKEIREEDYIIDPCLLQRNKHIIDKAEISLVETMNGSLRGHIARFIRRTKSFSKNFENLCDAVLLWIYGDTLTENKIRYVGCCPQEEKSKLSCEACGKG
jgi:hypothetical protein